MARLRGRPRPAGGPQDVPAEPPSPTASTPPATRSRLALLAALVLALVGFGSLVRVGVALSDPGFDADDPRGMLRSDPALLYYVTQRIADAGGLPPEDFRADPRVEHPETTDLPALLAVGQEFVVAWSRPLFPDGTPLHVVALVSMAVSASLAVAGVVGLAFELSGSLRLAAFAGLVCVLLPANYRTIGFLLVNEDVSVPWHLLHLWLLARAARVGTTTAAVLAALALAVALATWHAAAFFFALEAACLFAWFLASRENPFSRRGAWAGLAVLVVAGLAVPVLRETGFALSLGMQLAYGLAAAALWRARAGATRRGAVLVALATAAAAGAGAWTLARAFGGGVGHHAHVLALLGHKLLRFGVLPEDPRELPFEVRLMWQGPFTTLEPLRGLALLGLGTIPLVFGAALAWRARRGGADVRRVALVGALAAFALTGAWLVERTLVWPALLAPALAAPLLATVPAGRPRALACAVGLAGQAALFAGFVTAHRIGWYPPPVVREELTALVERVRALVPPGEAVAADFVTSPALLAHTGRPILFQPKWESERSRRRAEEFVEGFFRRTPAELRERLVGHYRCRYVVVDRATLGYGARYAAGLRPGEPALPGSAAQAFLARDAAALESIPGWKLLYRSPPTLRQSDGTPSDQYRLYELTP